MTVYLAAHGEIMKFKVLTLLSVQSTVLQDLTMYSKVPIFLCGWKINYALTLFQESKLRV